MIRILIIHLFLTNLAFAATDSVDTLSRDYASANADSRSASYEMKRDLLRTEFQVRNAANANAESILYQSRLALVTILMGFLVFLIERSRRLKGKNDNGSPAISKLVVLGLAFLIFCMYWMDCYINDLQDRVEVRATEVTKILNALPSMEQDQIDTLRIYPSLQDNNFPRKICLLLQLPNFAQFLAYLPLGLMLVFLIIRSYGNHRRAEKKN